MFREGAAGDEPGGRELLFLLVGGMARGSAGVVMRRRLFLRA